MQFTFDRQNVILLDMPKTKNITTQLHETKHYLHKLS